MGWQRVGHVWLIHTCLCMCVRANAHILSKIFKWTSTSGQEGVTMDQYGLLRKTKKSHIIYTTLVFKTTGHQTTMHHGISHDCPSLLAWESPGQGPAPIRKPGWTSEIPWELKVKNSRSKQLKFVWQSSTDSCTKRTLESQQRILPEYSMHVLNCVK